MTIQFYEQPVPDVRGNGEVGRALAADFRKHWNEALELEKSWCLWLRAHYKAKICTPNDGWVNRVEHSLTLPWYAHILGRDATVGDLIALGSSGSYTLHKIALVEKSKFFSDLTKYWFDPEGFTAFRPKVWKVWYDQCADDYGWAWDLSPAEFSTIHRMTTSQSASECHPNG